MKTIIQTIGPLYGDDANGTVFGQPNGSVYTPQTNLVNLLEKEDNNLYVKNGASYIETCDSSGNTGVFAKFQVITQVEWAWTAEIASDLAFTTVLGSITYDSMSSSAGVLKSVASTLAATIAAGAKYYIRGRVVTKYGRDTIVVTPTYEVTGVV